MNHEVQRALRRFQLERFRVSLAKLSDGFEELVKPGPGRLYLVTIGCLLFVVGHLALATVSARVQLEQLTQAREVEQAEYQRKLDDLEGRVKRLHPPPSVPLSAACPAWFFNTNIKAAKQQICKGK